MDTGAITRERVLEAAEGARTVTEVARRLAVCDAIMSGKTGRMLRGLVPELDVIVKGNRVRIRAATEPVWVDRERISPEEAAAKCPYNRGLYRALFIESAVAFQGLDTLIKRLAAMGHRESAVRYAWAVLKNPNHASNGKRSTLLNGNDGRVKLIALKRKPMGAC